MASFNKDIFGIIFYIRKAYTHIQREKDACMFVDSKRKVQIEKCVLLCMLMCVCVCVCCGKAARLKAFNVL